MLLLKTWRDLLARKGQFFGLVFLVLLGISTFVAFQTGYYDLTASVDKAIAELKFADFTVKVLGAPAGRANIIARIPGVRAVEARSVADVGLDVGDEEDSQAVARIVGLPQGRRPRVNDLLITDGSGLSDGGSNEALLHSQFSTDTGVGVGDSLTLRIGQERRRLRIVGIVDSAEYMYAIREHGDLPTPGDFAVLWMPERQAEEIAGRPGVVNEFAITIDRGADLDEVIDDVEDVLEPNRIVQTVKRANQPSNAAIQGEIEQNRAMAVFMPILILGISTSSLAITLSRLVQSQRGEIGLMKALGYTDLQVLGHYLSFSLVIAVLGSLLGFGLGDLMARGIATQYVDLLGIPFLTHNVYPSVVGGAVAISVAACLFAGAMPAWRSSRIPPAQAMHSDPNLALAGGRKPVVERIVGGLLPRSFTFRIPFRNVFRARRRSVYTILGMAFALILTVATASSFDSIDYLLDRAFGFLERWDVMAAFEQPFGGDRIAEVRTWAGVRDVQAARFVPAEITFRGGEHEGAITAMSPEATFHGWETLEGDPAPEVLARNELVVAIGLSNKLGLEVGDSVSIKTPYRDERTSVRVGAITDEMLGAPAFISLDEARVIVGTSSNEYNVLYLTVDPRLAQQVKDDLFDLRGASTVMVKEDMLRSLLELMEFADFYQTILFGFGFAMAFVVIYNTFTANVVERTREIATMRTIGESNSRLAVMVTIENLLLAVIGLPLGIWLGVQAAQALYSSFSTEAYTLTAVIHASSVVWLSFSMIGVLLISEIPPIRRIFKLDLAEATKVME